MPQILFPSSSPSSSNPNPPKKINVNPSILSFYTRTIVPLITRRATRDFAAISRSKGKNGREEFEDDGNYGSSVTADIAVLQLISKRIHYGELSLSLSFSFFPTPTQRWFLFISFLTGKFVSESKFRSDPASFIPHILKPNPQALEALIVKPAVEKALLERIVKKASIYGPELGPDGGFPGDTTNDGAGANWRIDAETMRELYEDWIIPLTKEVEVRWFLFFFFFYKKHQCFVC